MHASTTFENLLHQIKNSNLNFKLEQSPFSAVVFLKKSFVKDKSGIPLPPTTLSFADVHHDIFTENQNLKHRIFSLEYSNKGLKTDYENAVDNCEEVHELKSQLQTDLEHVHNIKEETNNADCEHEALKLKFEILENELRENRNETEKLIELNKNYKIEIKHVNAKYEKFYVEVKLLKDKNESLEKELKNRSVALKSVKQELKETIKKGDAEKQMYEVQIRKLSDIKKNYEKETKELKKKEKKLKKKKRKENRQIAESAVKKIKEERDIKIELLHDQVDILTIESEEEDNSEVIKKGAKIKTEVEPQSLNEENETKNFRNEAIEFFTANVKKFLKKEPGDTLDVTVDKLEALKSMFEPATNNEESKESGFDELITMVKTAKEAIENASKEDVYDDEYVDGMEDTNFPRHYWGGEGRK